MCPIYKVSFYSERAAVAAPHVHEAVGIQVSASLVTDERKRTRHANSRAKGPKRTVCREQLFLERPKMAAKHRL